jgi:hypothetical protein
MSLLCKTFPWMIVSVFAPPLPSPLPSMLIATSRPGFELSGARSPVDFWKRRYHSPLVSRTSACTLHRVCFCPVCHEDAYVRRRVMKVVIGALKRLHVPRTMSVLTYLGTDSWDEVSSYLAAKRQAWNELHPTMPMTLTNTALDHIRPVNEFQKNSFGEKVMLCNHFTNLQPLLHEDNAWKGDFWSKEDETYWHENIIFQSNLTSIYYPTTAPFQPSLLEAEGKACSHPSSHQTRDSISCSHRPRKQRSCEEH